VLPAEAVAAQLNFHGASFNGVGPINVMGSTLDLTTVLGYPDLVRLLPCWPHPLASCMCPAKAAP